jgi:RND family efflux transporter MFP subunit
MAEAQYIVARRQLKDTKISTPISGIVTARPVDIGAMVQNGMVVANVVDVSRMKVKLSVAERDAFKLKVGDAVEVVTDVYPGVTFPGKIATLSAKADEGHTYPVEVVLANSKAHPLKAGMFGKVQFTSIGSTDVVAIPRQALVGSMKNPQVFVIDQQIARLRTIVIGGETGTSLGIVGGLKDGELVVTNGQNNLKDGMSVDVLK